MLKLNVTGPMNMVACIRTVNALGLICLSCKCAPPPPSPAQRLTLSIYLAQSPVSWVVAVGGVTSPSRPLPPPPPTSLSSSAVLIFLILSFFLQKIMNMTVKSRFTAHQGNFFKFLFGRFFWSPVDTAHSVADPVPFWSFDPWIRVVDG